MAIRDESSHSKPNHFYKIICQQNLHQGKLSIPTNFMENYGDGLPKSIFLNTPNGAKWKIHLEISDGKIWFEKGLKEFVEHHSLSHGHLLLFRYESTSNFEVHIFDKGAFEIDYLRASQKRKAPNPYFEIGSSSGVKVGKSQKVYNVHHTHKKYKGKQVISGAIERAKCFKTCNPSFVIVMGASYVENHFHLRIPCEFGKKHFDLDKRGDIDFHVLNGSRVWHARYLKRMTSKGQVFELSSGWKEFAMDNKLKVGDACNFELILSSPMTFQVHIFRDKDNDNINCSTSKKSSQMKGEATQVCSPTTSLTL